MKRKVLYFKKNKLQAIQGVCNAGTLGIGIGFACDGGFRHGGGFVGDMEVQGQCIVIRKVDPAGKPYRNYGKVSPTGQVAKEVVLSPADGVMFPLTYTEGVVFLDEPEPQKAVK